MNEKNNDNTDKKFDVPIVGHEYDGIKEFNNPAPFWWQLFFYLSIIFAVGYYVYYQFGGGQSSEDQIASQMQVVENLKRAQVVGSSTEDLDFTQFVNNTEKIKLGKEVYMSKCAACHTADGGGLVGPNLTDEYWLHGKGEIKDLYATIDVGVPEKGMPPWGASLSKDELISVAVFVKSLYGTHPAAPKAPQGVKVQ